MREENQVQEPITDPEVRGSARTPIARMRRVATVSMGLAAISAAALIGASASSARVKATIASSKGVTHAQQVVDSYLGPTNGYHTPAQAVKGLKKVKGKTVMYIPLIQQVPAFAITASGLQAALKTVGAKLTICNGAGNPTSVAACVSQGEGQHVAGIITDSIPFQLAANAFTGAEAKNIPVLITDQVPDPTTIKAKKLEYMPGNLNQPQLIADWIIADSKGKANVVVGEENQGPSQIYYITHGLQPEFKKYCPACSVKVIDIPLDPTGAASSVTAGLNSDPGAQYYYGEFEDELQGALQGIQESGKTNSIRAEFATATIAGLTKMKQHQTLYAEIGDDVNYQGWADADSILRMIVGQPVVQENIPERIFDRANIKTISLTQAAQASGVWYGNPNTFKKSFERLWGVIK